MEVECPYCGELASLIDSAKIYGKSYGMVWSCHPCDAYVGVHKNDGKNRPLGSLANRETRVARKMAHERFDPIWKNIPRKGRSKNKVRSAAYSWLAGHLSIPVEECHIALFDLRTCVSVIEICLREDYADL